MNCINCQKPMSAQEIAAYRCRCEECYCDPRDMKKVQPSEQYKTGQSFVAAWQGDPEELKRLGNNITQAHHVTKE